LRQFEFRVKRALDCIVSSILVLLLLPLFALLALLIKLESSGDVFYRAERIGKAGKPFRMWKFRTMLTGADRMGPGLTEHGDPRITRVGSVLRRLSLDELPQLLNVLAGEMSLVGPRPEIAEIVDTYTPQQRLALSVLPGITGLSQINGRDDLPVDDKVAFDLEYVNGFSLIMDLKIVLKTIPAIISGRGNRC